MNYTGVTSIFVITEEKNFLSGSLLCCSCLTDWITKSVISKQSSVEHDSGKHCHNTIKIFCQNMVKDLTSFWILQLPFPISWIIFSYMQMKDVFEPAKLVDALNEWGEEITGQPGVEKMNCFTHKIHWFCFSMWNCSRTDTF